MWKRLRAPFNSMRPLSPTPLDIGSTPLLIAPPKGLDVLTNRAQLIIDVSPSVDPELQSDPQRLRVWMPRLFPPTAIEAVLLDSRNRELPLSQSRLVLGQRRFFLALSNCDLRWYHHYRGVRIRSTREIRASQLYWSNAGFETWLG